MLMMCNELTDKELVMLTRDIINKAPGDQMLHIELAKSY